MYFNHFLKNVRPTFVEFCITFSSFFVPANIIFINIYKMRPKKFNISNAYKLKIKECKENTKKILSILKIFQVSATSNLLIITNKSNII